MVRKSPSADASSLSVGTVLRSDNDGDHWQVRARHKPGGLRRDAHYWARKGRKRGGEHARMRYGHEINRYFKPIYGRTLTNFMLLQGDLSAKTFYHNGEYIYAFCDPDPKNPVCYVVSNTLRGEPKEPNPSPLSEPRENPTKIQIAKWENFYARLLLQTTVNCLTDVYRDYDDPGFYNILDYAQNRVQAQNGPKPYLKKMLAKAKAYRKKRQYNAFEYPRDPILEAMAPAKERYQQLLKDLFDDKNLAFNLILMTEKMSCGMLVHLVRYVDDMAKLERFRELVRFMTGISLVENATFMLVYDYTRINIGEAQDALQNAALRGRVIGFFCSGTGHAKWVITYQVGKTVFYLEPCDGQPTWDNLQKRKTLWGNVAHKVGEKVTMSCAPVVGEARMLRLLDDRDFVDVFSYRHEISRHFWGDNFWDCSGRQLDSMQTIEELASAKAYPIWLMIAVLSQKDYNPFLVVDPDTKKAEIRAAIQKFEDKCYDLLEDMYDYDYFCETAHVLFARWNFNLSLGICKDPKFKGLFEKRRLEFSLILELVCTLDEIVATEPFKLCDREIRDRVLRFERTLLEVLRVHL